jgi:hypothetical protein
MTLILIEPDAEVNGIFRFAQRDGVDSLSVVVADVKASAALNWE